MKSYTRVRRPAHLINLAYFTVCLIGILIAALHYEVTHGATLEDYPYSVAPRLLHNCESKWIGTEYHPLPTCTKVWGMLTREAILQESDYFSNPTTHAN